MRSTSCSRFITRLNGDPLLSRYRSSSEIQSGDIIAVESLDEGWKFYLVQTVSPLIEEDLLLKTISGCDRCPEWWIVSSGDKILVSQVRYSYAGYFLDFLGSWIGIIFTATIVLTLLGIMIFSRKSKARDATT